MLLHAAQWRASLTCELESVAGVQDTLFADTSVYEYEAQEQLAITAWYVAKDFADAFDVGFDAAQKLVEKFPEDEQKKANVEWYEKLKEGLV